MRKIIIAILAIAISGVGGCASSNFDKLNEEVNEGEQRVNEIYEKVEKYKAKYDDIANQVRLTLDLYYGTEDITGVREIAIKHKDSYTEEEWKRFKKMDELLGKFRKRAKVVDTKVRDLFVKIKTTKQSADEWFSKIKEYINIARNLNENINDVIKSAEE